MFFDRPDSGERAVLVHLDLQRPQDCEDLREFEALALSAGADPVACVRGRREAPDARYFVGSGKLQTIRDTVQQHDAQLVLFNHALSPSQERNLETALQCRVLDRTGLILDIFAQRAHSHAGRLQVELAQLQYMSTRLVRGWTHLERQKGGIGLRGPGETQLETDRRLLRARVKSLRQRLQKVHRQRQQSRQSRRRAEIATVSLVGYTNAGKSTLFNALSDANVLVADQLFATLDATLRRITVPGLGAVILADTVGFIRHLPHTLVESFKATLEDVASADLLLHVIDYTDPDRISHEQQVEAVLAEIDAADRPCLRVYNKIDASDAAPHIERDNLGCPVSVYLSAQKRQGLPLLLTAIAECLDSEQLHVTLLLSPQQGALKAALYACNAVLSEHYDQHGVCGLEIRLPRRDFYRSIDTKDAATTKVC